MIYRQVKSAIASICYERQVNQFLLCGTTKIGFIFVIRHTFLFDVYIHVLHNNVYSIRSRNGASSH